MICCECLIFEYVQKYRDAEAKIVQHVDLNQWECVLYVISFLLEKIESLLKNSHFRPNGVTFIATPTIALTSKWQLKPGDIVTFTYQGRWERTNKPRSPNIVRVRLDKTWEDVVNDFNSNKCIPSGSHFAGVYN
jgi:hypothetical protein